MAAAMLEAATDTFYKWKEYGDLIKAPRSF